MSEANRPLAAALWMIGSITAFTAMAVAGREVSSVHDTFEIMTWRSLIGFVIVLAVATVTLRIPEDPATHSDNIRPPVPGYPATCDALP